MHSNAILITATEMIFHSHSVHAGGLMYGQQGKCENSWGNANESMNSIYQISHQLFSLISMYIPNSTVYRSWNYSPNQLNLPYIVFLFVCRSFRIRNLQSTNKWEKTVSCKMICCTHARHFKDTCLLARH